ncbi:MAG: sugar ABC transporter permease [Clostridia bacterium]|nr:sugar ABC transporter permease [Clostridia bacterium]MBO4886514.1 sugar ABC transporter permease [Clostridia bacterium]
MALAKSTGIRSRKKTIWKRAAENWQMYLFLLLPLVWLFIFKYWPMYGAQIAFRNYKVAMGITGSPWVGFAQFEKFFRSVYFKRVVGNTLFLSLYSMIVGFPLPILFALLLNSVRSKRWRSAVENVTYMPYFISAVVLVGILKRVFDLNSGLFSNILMQLTGSKMETDLFRGNVNFQNLYVWSGVWQGTGWGSIIYMAALSNVDPEQHEAATIDGASRWQRLIHVDLPAIVPTITITLILRCGSLMSIGFDKAFLMQNDTNLAASEVISTYVYKVGLTASGGNNFSYSTAIGLFNSVINLIMISLVNFVSNRINGSGLW